MSNKPTRNKRKPAKLAESEAESGAPLPKQQTQSGQQNQSVAESAGATQHLDLTNPSFPHNSAIPTLTYGSSVYKSLVTDVVQNVTSNLREEIASLAGNSRTPHVTEPPNITLQVPARPLQNPQEAAEAVGAQMTNPGGSFSPPVAMRIADPTDFNNILPSADLTLQPINPLPLKLPAVQPPIIVGVPRFSHSETLSVRIKGKIWADQYVDFSELLPKRESPSGTSCTIDNFTISLAAAKTKNQIKTFMSWVSAFHKFVAIYCQKYPGKSVALMHYADIIEEIHQKGGDFLKYDQEFRQLRESQVYPWDRLFQELYNRAFPGPQASSQIDRAHRGSTSNVSSCPPGFCFIFNSGDRCNTQDCKYTHRCGHCSGKHPKAKCHELHGKPQDSASGTNNASAKYHQNNSYRR